MLGRGDGDRGVLGDLLGDGAGDVEQASLGSEALDQPDGEGLGGIEAAAGEDEVLGAARSDEASEALGSAAAGDDAEADLGEAELGGGGGDAEVAGEGELRATAEGRAVDCGNEDGVAGLDCPEGAAESAQEGTDLGLAHGGALLEVGAGAEGLLPGAGEDDDPDLLTRGDAGDARVELGEHGAADGVAGPPRRASRPPPDRGVPPGRFPWVQSPLGRPGPGWQGAGPSR